MWDKTIKHKLLATGMSKQEHASTVQTAKQENDPKGL